jgi:hypothetical protein
MAHHRHRTTVMQHVLSSSAPIAPSRTWLAQLAELRRIDRALGGPVDAVNRAKASGLVMRGYSRLLVWLMRDELQTLPLTPSQDGE